MVFDIFACVALGLSSLCTLFFVLVCYSSYKTYSSQKSKINDLKSMFGGDYFDSNA